ncbi:hypothetical protein GCM10023340_18930 [Nocardioides marinquilinus]|uniref:Uncharacterized protein n=1 Tax=Nocardioides marinquilinus TaxID=1210400 RepID=A0ABP9PIK6_9ACTN
MTVSVLPRSLAHPGVDPPSLVDRARAALGWQGSDFLVGLQGYDELMATLAVAADVEGLVRVPDPASPPVRLLRALAAPASAAVGLRVSRVAAVPAPWRWTRVGGGSAEIAGVALRQQTYADVVETMGRAGVSFRVVPDRATTDELVALGRDLGSAVLDAGEVDDETLVVPGWLDELGPVGYGLISRDGGLGTSETTDDMVWLSLRARQETAGTLVVALEQVAAMGIDLDFLHSDPHAASAHSGRHDFYVGFVAPGARVHALREALTGVGFSSRVLAAFAPPAADAGP